MPICDGLPDIPCPYRAKGRDVLFRYAEFDLCPCCELQRRELDNANVTNDLIQEASQFRNKWVSNNGGVPLTLMCQTATEESNEETTPKLLPSYQTGTGYEMCTNYGSIIIDPLLSYTSFSLQNGTIENIKKCAVNNFALETVVHSKNLLWEKCDKSVIGEKAVWRDTSVRTQKEAHIDDILKALQKLDKCNQMPHLVIDALSIGALPKVNPEELNNVSFVDRQNKMEDKLLQLQETMDGLITENISIKESVYELKKSRLVTNYASVVSSTIGAQPVTITSRTSKDKQPHQGNSSNDNKQQSVSHVKETNQNIKNPKQRNQNEQHSENSQLDSDTQLPFLQYMGTVSLDASTNFSEPFHIPSYHRRKQKQRDNRRRNIIRGKANSDPVKGGQEPTRQVFIYRVNTDTETEDLKTHIQEKGFDVISLNCISNEASKFKSFKLEVPMHQFQELFNEELWPKGICVRKFYRPQAQNNKGGEKTNPQATPNGHNGT